ncbi:T9SS type A sorting domain-containing protein [Tamlana agarivorans]|uniref:T9SS type A sorting domain-containing protein n=1 Tax=Pseudotamlana agarivorans TaxID=481183 RepID=A0ACC5U9D6_9FLAO|nr:T9SS type A sorting domain-containing protein [Tamlana agarivorans]MBU2950943.1 T9SS type A sorting domain-containing protein [Tamlana agarivorans]
MRKTFLLLFTACLTLLSIGVKAQADPNSPNNYDQKSYGIFVHYGWGGDENALYGCQITPNPDGSTYPKSVDETANNFDLDGFVDDIAAMSPEYLIFTVWHCGMNPLYPSAKMEEWLGPGHSSQRDVVQELLDACDARGIDVYFYIQPSEAHDFSPEEQAKVGYINQNKPEVKYNDFINEVIAELTERYKSQFKGYWFDKGLNYRCTNTERIGNTVRAIMPDAVLIGNGHSNVSADFGAVETKNPKVTFERDGYTGINNNDENTWPAYERSISFVSDRSWAAEPGSIRYSSEQMYKYTVLEAGVNEEGGGVAWAIGPYPTTTISWNSGIVAGMTGLGTLIDAVAESIKSTIPSDSWPTPEGTTINDLTWGVATRSAAGNFEYLHVLKAPSGNTLSIDAPADGRQYDTAVNLRTGKTCSLTQTANQLTVTLDGSDSWDTVDSVIKLTSSTLSTNNQKEVKEFTIYPNPTSDKIHIRSNQNGSSDGTVEIINLQGKLVNNMPLKSFPMVLNTSELKEGFYVLKIKTESGTSIHKIIKK